MNLLTKKRRDGQELSQPVSTLSRLRQDMDELFDRFIEGGPDWAFTRPGLWAPTVDFSEGEKDFTLRVEIPGVDPKDVDVSVTGSVVTVSGEKSESSERKEDSCCIAERRFGSFKRSIELPPYANTDKVDARFDNGVLTVVIGKEKTAESKHIPIGKTH